MPALTTSPTEFLACGGEEVAAGGGVAGGGKIVCGCEAGGRPRWDDDDDEPCSPLPDDWLCDECCWIPEGFCGRCDGDGGRWCCWCDGGCDGGCVAELGGGAAG